MLLSSLQPPLLERSLLLSKFHCHKEYDHPASCNRLHRGYQECGCPLSSPYNFGAETHLGAGDTSAFVSPWPPLLDRSLRLPVAVLFLGKAHEDSDHTAVIAVVH